MALWYYNIWGTDMGGQRLLYSTILLSTLCFSNCTGTSPALQPVERTQPESFILDHRNPLSVVEAVLYAADTGDIDVLCNLCDPQLMNDEKTEDLCFIAEKDIPRFRNQYMGASIAGEVEYRSEFSIGGEVEHESEYALVTLSSTKPSGEITFVLVKRYGNWYLYEID